MRQYNLIKEHNQTCSVESYSVHDIGDFIGYFLTSESPLKLKISIKA